MRRLDRRSLFDYCFRLEVQFDRFGSGVLDTRCD
jgi:hypothetical protein